MLSENDRKYPKTIVFYSKDDNHKIYAPFLHIPSSYLYDAHSWYTDSDMSASNKIFEKIYSEYYAEIRRFIYTIARRDPDITDDISQNMWQNVWRYIGSLRDESSARSWLYAIARNEAKRYFANRHTAFFSNAQTLEEEEAGDIVDEPDSAFPDELANSDLLAKLLDRLGPEEQRLILLYYAYDVGLKEISQLSGMNYNTLKSNFRRTMEKLRAAAIEMGEKAG